MFITCLNVDVVIDVEVIISKIYVCYLYDMNITNIINCNEMHKNYVYSCFLIHYAFMVKCTIVIL